MYVNPIEQLIQQIKADGLYRQRQPHNSINTTLNFSSNDYLSLTNDPRIKSAYQTGFANYPTGSGGSMVVCGYHAIHRELEQTFADVLQTDDCLLFSSGSAANVSVINLLARIGSFLVIDKNVHASMYDGLAKNNIKYVRYNHNDVQSLASKISLLENRENLTLLTESIFSMSGSVSPLQDLYQTIQHPTNNMIVDEAHAFGLIGREGLGGVVKFGLTQKEVPLRVIPLGKAFGSAGAIVAGNALWIDALLQTSRAYIYSTGFSPAIAYGLLQTLSIVREADDKRAHLFDLVAYFRQKIANSPLTWRDSDTPVQQLQLGCPYRAVELAKNLRAKDLICSPMRQPTVSKSETGLRIILNANHEYQHIDRLFDLVHAESCVV